jgi:hypothetical protein
LLYNWKEYLMYSSERRGSPGHCNPHQWRLQCLGGDLTRRQTASQGWGTTLIMGRSDFAQIRSQGVVGGATWSCAPFPGINVEPWLLFPTIFESLRSFASLATPRYRSHISRYYTPQLCQKNQYPEGITTSHTIQ